MYKRILTLPFRSKKTSYLISTMYYNIKKWFKIETSLHPEKSTNSYINLGKFKAELVT